MKGAPQIFVYKMTADNGGAPCVTDNLLTLAICKPVIRKLATQGALLFGFGGKKYKGRLIYIAKVTGKLEGPAYYRQRKFLKRLDCIYRFEKGKAVLKRSAKYHQNPDERERDVGIQFEKAFVLLSKDFRYLGSKGTTDFNEKFPKVGLLVERLKQGHRSRFEAELRNELLYLKEEIWKKYCHKRKVGTPSDDARGC